ncbi:MAG TPA: hypothetical protein VH328_00930, partial [Burkholderiaceae bacterium]|nr:hypothetical protein [Burkholderiaceae bacterium]
MREHGLHRRDPDQLQALGGIEGSGQTGHEFLAVRAGPAVIGGIDLRAQRVDVGCQCGQRGVGRRGPRRAQGRKRRLNLRRIGGQRGIRVDAIEPLIECLFETQADPGPRGRIVRYAERQRAGFEASLVYD